MRHTILSLLLLTTAYTVCTETNQVDELTPLMQAAQKGKLTKVETLLRNGADWSAIYKGETALDIVKRVKKKHERSSSELSYMRKNNRPRLIELYYEEQRNFESVKSMLKKKEPGCFSLLIQKIKSALYMSTALTTDKSA